MRTMHEGYAPQSTAGAPRRSIAVVGDDPLMVRALDRLLRTAGYSVGVDDRPSDPDEGRAYRGPHDVALTIVDVPDDWSRAHGLEANHEDLRNVDPGRILWIGAPPPCGYAPEGFLGKPFTSTQLLDKVRTLLCHQVSR